MRYFPAFLDLAGRPVFVVGGGETAARKARLLLKAGARVTFWGAAPEAAVRAEFGGSCAYRERPLGVLRPRPALVVAASEDRGADTRAAALARAAGVPVNVVDLPGQCDFTVPSIVERGDLVVGISTGGDAPVLGRRIREKIEAMLPSRLGDLVAWAGAKRAEVAERVPTRDRRDFWERLLEGPAAEAVLRGDEAGAERAYRDALSGEARTGHVHIVGAGPGDPELLTLKALRVLQEADVVLHDHLASDGVMELVRRDAERISVGKRRAAHTLTQDETNALMVRLAREGRRVVRLKGGDPYVFGRGGEEVDACRAAGVPCTVVPGVTAALGCGASIGVPVTHRGLSQAVTFVTAQGAPKAVGDDGAAQVDWDALARLGHTVVVYMGVALAGRVAAALIAGGRAAGTPVAVVENGTLPSEKIVRATLGTLTDAMQAGGIAGPAVLIIGEVAARAGAHDLATLTQEAA